MDDTQSDVNLNLNQNVPLSVLDDDKSSHEDNPQVIPPAQHDSSSASGHAPDLEVDDDVDELGHDAGLEYSDTEELGIDHKVNVTTEPEPPVEDQPY